MSTPSLWKGEWRPHRLRDLPKIIKWEAEPGLLSPDFRFCGFVFVFSMLWTSCCFIRPGRETAGGGRRDGTTCGRRAHTALCVACSPQHPGQLGLSEGQTWLQTSVFPSASSVVWGKSLNLSLFIYKTGNKKWNTLGCAHTFSPASRRECSEWQERACSRTFNRRSSPAARLRKRALAFFFPHQQSILRKKETTHFVISCYHTSHIWKYYLLNCSSLLSILWCKRYLLSPGKLWDRVLCLSVEDKQLHLCYQLLGFSDPWTHEAKHIQVKILCNFNNIFSFK